VVLVALLKALSALMDLIPYLLQSLLLVEVLVEMAAVRELLEVLAVVEATPLEALERPRRATGAETSLARAEATTHTPGALLLVEVLALKVETAATAAAALLDAVAMGQLQLSPDLQ